MIKFICFFLPSFISLFIDIKLNKIKVFNYELVIRYFIYNFIINLLGNSAVYFISSEKIFIIWKVFSHMSLFLNTRG